MGTIIVGIVIAGIAALVIRTMVRDWKNGKSCHCSGNCSSCGKSCK